MLLGAHRDSWDLGTGAIDDAAGCGIVIEAARLIGLLPKHPARTIRVCLYANEENGLAGGKAYLKAHQAELDKHAAALESDSGTDRPTGFSWTAGPSAEPFVKEVAAILEPLGAGTLSAGRRAEPTPGRSRSRACRCSWCGRTPRGTSTTTTRPTTRSTRSIRRGWTANVAAVAVFAYCAASTPELLERIPPDKRGRAAAAGQAGDEDAMMMALLLLSAACSLAAVVGASGGPHPAPLPAGEGESVCEAGAGLH